MEDVLASTLKIGYSVADANMKNSYGVLVGNGGILVSNTGSSTVLLYKKGSICTTIPVPTPTGMCWGKCGDLYVASTSGTIYAISKGSTNSTTLMTADRLPASGAVGVVDGITSIAYYKDKLYVVVPSLWLVQVYDITSSPPKELYDIVDDDLATFNYRPLGITLNDDSLYITYSDGTTQPGFGYINRYKPKCSSMERFASRGRLARPYSVVVIGDRVYVSNGSGCILVYTEDGEYVDNLNFFSDGLRSLAPYNGKLAYVAASNSTMMGTLGVVEINRR